MSTLPSVNELPYYNTKTAASIDLLNSNKPYIEFISGHIVSNNTLSELDKPIALKMVQMKTPYLREISNASTFSSTLMIGIYSFLISMLLHILLKFSLHRFKNLHRFKQYSFFESQTKEKIELKSVLSAAHKIDQLRTHPDSPWKDKCVYIPEHHTDRMSNPQYVSPSCV